MNNAERTIHNLYCTYNMVAGREKKVNGKGLQSGEGKRYNTFYEF